jgi:hypothetical protein
MTFYPDTSGRRARILILSMRNLSTHASRCSAYEFEDTIRACDAADMLAPRQAVPRGQVMRRVSRAIGQSHRIVAEPIPPGRHYDLLLALCQSPSDLRHLPHLRELRERCARSACLLEEVWNVDIERWSRDIRWVANFDAVFTLLGASVPPLSKLLGRACHHVLGGVDAMKFCPYPDPPVRSIDVYSMGRRSGVVHTALMRLAEKHRWFYLYDTVANFSVIDPPQHRWLLSNFIKRSRYFMAYPAKFNSPDETRGQNELGLRQFEGAAGGAVMLGSPPRSEAYNRNFDWPDAIIPVSATNGADVGDVMTELDRQPERVARIRRDNVANSLLRHDWVYRWRSMLEIVGLAPSPEMTVREADLKRLAGIVNGL